jgi:hypothetical protein
MRSGYGLASRESVTWDFGLHERRKFSYAHSRSCTLGASVCWEYLGLATLSLSLYMSSWMSIIVAS